MKPTGTAVPSLDEFIAASRKGKGRACAYVRATTPEQRAKISAKVADDIHAWTACLRWLQATGSELSSAHVISYHYERGHSDDE